MKGKALYILVLLLLFFVSIPAGATEFAPVGARAQGMGGAFVAVANDATAVYWNPAGLAAFRGWEAQGLVSVRGQDHMGVVDVLQNVRDILNGQDVATAVAADPAKVNALADLVKSLDHPGAGVDSTAAAGVIVKGHVASHGFAFSALPIFQAGATMVVDTANLTAATIASNQSKALLNGLEARQYALSYAHALLPNLIYAGINLKMIDGFTYHFDVPVLAPNNKITIDDLRRSQINTQAFSFDVGIMATPCDWLRVGVTGRDLNQPKFDSSRGTRFTLQRQIRAGVAVLPMRTLTISADADLTENDSFTNGYKERIVALGVEKSFFCELFTVRAGGYKNVKESSSSYVGTAGLGFRIWPVTLDLGGGYDFNGREAMASASIAGRF
jgi:hypothetical protein